jgi:putative ABC transport system permease protein
MMKVLSDSRVFNATVWQPLRANAGRTILAIIAIAMGVALGLSIFLVTGAATTETARASRSLFGEADLIVQGTQEGFDEALYPLIAQIPGVRLATPVIEVRVQLPGKHRPLIIMGRDLLQASRIQIVAPSNLPSSSQGREALALLDANSIHLSASAAKTLQVNVSDVITLQVGMQPVTFKIAGVLPSGAYEQDLGLMDIATAQWRLDKLGKLTRIEIYLAKSTDAASAFAAIAKVLPSGVAITTPENESQRTKLLVRPITINLLAVALVALFTGAFLVYSTQALSVIRRRREFALLNALGVTAQEQIAQVITTGTILGTIGATLGVPIGIGIGKFGLQFISTGATVLEFAPAEIAAFALLGILTSIAGSIAPALSAARIPTAQALKAGNVDEPSNPNHTLVALALWFTAMPLLLAPPLFELPLLGYAAIAFILFGAVLIIPTFTGYILSILPRRSHLSYQVALAQLRGVAHTATTSIATILVSVSLMVAMSIMGASLRGSMAQWTERLFPADIIIQMGLGLSYLDTDAEHKIASLKGVEKVEPLRSIPLLLSNGQAPVTLYARSTDLLELEATATGSIPQNAIPVLINLALAERQQLSPDDTIHFQLAGREVLASVRGIWRDYFTPNGALVIDYHQYQNITNDERINTLSIWITPETSVEETVNRIRKLTGSSAEITISLPGDIRARVLKGFDGFFSIIYLLLAVSVLIGLFGIGVNTSAQVLARRAEFGVLRHLGFTRAQIATLLGAEGFCLGALGVLSGLLVGSVISMVMIYIITPQSFHWTMDLHVPLTILISLVIFLPIATGLTALWSGRSAMNDDVIRAVKEDW